MKVIALGGCGAMGRYAVAALETFDDVDEIVVADIDEERATEYAKNRGPKVIARGVDAADDHSLREVMDGADFVLNTVGPFYETGTKVLDAAIATGTNYLDICDDWEPTLEMLERDSAAKRAGIVAVVGVGASPGVSNLLAVKAMQELDEVEKIFTGWSFGDGGLAADENSSGSTGSGHPSAALVHWMYQCSGTIRLFRDGRFVDVAPLEEIVVDYPGVGRGRAWTVGHPEAVTLPMSRAGITESANLMVGSPLVVEIVRGLAGRIDSEEMTAAEAASALLSGTFGAAPSVERSELDAVRLPPLFALASGRRGGVSATVGALVLATPPGGMGGATGVPLALGVAELTSANATQGVLTPEQAFRPDAFFERLGRFCEPPLLGSEVIYVSH